MSTVTIAIAIIANGLLAGVFFAFSTAVTPGLKGTDDNTYVRTFSAINRAILNGRFLLVFLLAPLSGLGCLVLALFDPDRGAFGLISGGSVFALATFVITAAVNVPLNQGLESSAAGDGQNRLARQKFEARWNCWNRVRTISSTAAFACLTAAAIV